MLPMISSFFFEDDTHVIVSTYGRGLWKLNLDTAVLATVVTTGTQEVRAILPRSEPLVVDPTTGAFVRLDTFEARRTCPTCRYVVAREGEITDVQMTDLTVHSVKLSQGTLVAVGADRREVQPSVPFTVERVPGTFGANRIVSQIQAQQLPIRGLVLDGMVLKGVIVSSEQVTLEQPRPPVLHLETRDTMAGIAKALPNETVIVRGEGFAPEANAPVVIKVGDREATRVQAGADSTFTARFEVREPPGDYDVVAEQASARGVLVAKSALKVTLRDVR
jgi:hypothetical protein